jgi:hypothetical protein
VLRLQRFVCALGAEQYPGHQAISYFGAAGSTKTRRLGNRAELIRWLLAPRLIA